MMMGMTIDVMMMMMRRRRRMIMIHLSFIDNEAEED
jgi:hypothetical protein